MKRRAKCFIIHKTIHKRLGTGERRGSRRSEPTISFVLFCFSGDKRARTRHGVGRCYPRPGLCSREQGNVGVCLGVFGNAGVGVWETGSRRREDSNGQGLIRGTGSFLPL